MSWIGGKKLLRDAVLCRFPLDYDRFIEVFGGGGWVLFHKPPRKDLEVYNDFNVLLSNLFRCVRDKPDLLITAIQQAAWFYQIIRQSYASGLTSFASQPHDMWNDFPLIKQASRRLKDVVVENQDFEKLIGHYDRPSSFFYCDPPYHATEGYYKNIGECGFRKKDHYRLRDALLEIEGKFLLSYNDDPFVRRLYTYPGIMIQEVTRPNSIKLRYENGAQFPELLIANYDTNERMRATSQLALF